MRLAGEKLSATRSAQADVSTTECQFFGPDGPTELSAAQNVAVYESADDFRASQLTVPLGPVTLSALRATPFRASRSRARIHSHPGDSLLVSFVRRGQIVGNHDDRSIRAASGSVFLLRSGRPFRYTAARGIDLVTLSAPISTLKPHAVARVTLLTARPLDVTASLRALGAYTQALLETAFDLDETEREHIGQTVLHLVNSTILSLPADSSSEENAQSTVFESLYREAVELIERRFTDEQLCAEWLAAKLRVTHRQLQRSFHAHDDAIERHIREIRLDAVARILASDEAGASITEVFRGQGFANVATGARAFRNRFAVPPRQYAAFARS
jgi:AraC-like DNA-binding protein